MSDSVRQNQAGGASVRGLEIVVAAAIMGFGALVMHNNWQLGARWGADGPQAGYFPFYVGLLMFAASMIVFIRALLVRTVRRRFVEPAQFRSVLALLVPSILYIVIMAFVGIYVSAALYLAYFMRVLGQYRWRIVLPLACGIPILMFLVFEMWFLVPLPKGPLEEWLGY